MACDNLAFFAMLILDKDQVVVSVSVEDKATTYVPAMEDIPKHQVAVDPLECVVCIDEGGSKTRLRLKKTGSDVSSGR